MLHFKVFLLEFLEAVIGMSSQSLSFGGEGSILNQSACAANTQ